MSKHALLLSILLLPFLQGKAQPGTDSIARIVQRAVQTEAFEGTVLVAEKGNILYHQSFGYADAEKRVPVDNQSRFSVASITKLFTAIVVLELVQEGKFALDDNLKTLLPEYRVPKARKVTVHHLLLHIAGMPNENDAIYERAVTPQAFARETLRNKGHRFGTFHYSNLDYVLLGLLVEKYDGRSWQQAVRDRILNKLDMKNTGFLIRNQYPEHFASTFSYTEKGARRQDPSFNIENFYAAGCMYSSAEDLLKLDQAMYGDRLLNSQSQERMYTSHPEYNYTGYGVWTYHYPFAATQPRVMERRGSIMGANAVLIRMLDTNKTIIIISNNDRFSPDSFGNTQGLKEALMVELGKS